MLKVHYNRPCVFVLDTYLYVVGGFPKQKTMEALNLKNLTMGWQQSVPLHVGFHHTACATVNDTRVVLTGGRYAGYHSNGKRSLIWHRGDHKWTLLPPMHESREYHCSVSDDVRYVYAVGGDRLGSMERYDTVKHKWTMMGRMPQKLKVHACVCVDGTIIGTYGISC